MNNMLLFAAAQRIIMNNNPLTVHRAEASDKCWELMQHQVIEIGDFIELKRGHLTQVLADDPESYLWINQKTKDLPRVGFLGLFKSRAFRSGMIKR